MYASIVGSGSSEDSADTGPSSAMSFSDYLQTYYKASPGRVFQYISSTVNFWDAEQACSAKKMKLACPQNPLQQAAINQMVMSTSWLGFVDYYVDGEFECVDGTGAMGWTNWGLKQPDNSYGDETDADFTVVVFDQANPNHLKWEDTGSYAFPDHKFGAVCQMECTVGNMDGCIPNK